MYVPGVGRWLFGIGGAEGPADAVTFEPGPREVSVWTFGRLEGRALGREHCGVLLVWEKELSSLVRGFLSLLEYNLQEGRPVTHLPHLRGSAGAHQCHSCFWPKLEVIDSGQAACQRATQEPDRLLEGQASLDSHWAPRRDGQALPR